MHSFVFVFQCLVVGCSDCDTARTRSRVPVADVRVIYAIESVEHFIGARFDTIGGSENIENMSNKMINTIYDDTDKRHML